MKSEDEEMCRFLVKNNGFKIDDETGIYKDTAKKCYRIIDLLTGYDIIVDRSKKRLLERFASEDIQTRLSKVRNSKHYKELVEQFQRLKEEYKKWN